MKKIRLSKELAGISAVALLFIASCGGGGGGSTPSSPPTTTPSTSPTTGTSTPPTPTIKPSAICPPSNNPYTLNICSGADYFNEPVVTVYINGYPVDLLVDTGASGLIVNQAAVAIPQSAYSHYSYTAVFGDGSSETGVLASATVCLNPSNTATCVVMPIGVNTSGNAFPSSGEIQGDFGLDSGWNVMDVGYNSSGQVVAGVSYPYYLEYINHSINSYTLSFYSLTYGYYNTYLSATTPIGTIDFGTYNGNSQTLISYTTSKYGLYIPSTTAYFNGSFTNVAIFDTGSNVNFLSTQALEAGIPNFLPSDDEGACGPPNNIVGGGFVLSYSIQQNNSQTYTTSFTTEPSIDACGLLSSTFTVVSGVTLDAGDYTKLFDEDFGLPEMLRHTFTWVLYPAGSYYQGFVQYIGINP